MSSFISITRKVALGYLLLTIFSLLAVGYALISLHGHDRRSAQLVGGQFQAFSLLRDIRQNLQGQDALEKQLMILRDANLQVLLKKRAAELDQLLEELKTSPLPDYLRSLPVAAEEYTTQAQSLAQIIADGRWEQAAAMAANSTTPLREQLLEKLADLRARHQATLDSELADLSRHSRSAYRMTLVITLIGIALSAPAAITVIMSIHKSVRALKKATHDVAAGSYNPKIDIRGNDEFGQLAQDFSRMARKLKELEELNLDANPLTRLPGNLAIDRELEKRILEERPFAHLYIDLDNFKAYGDRYGYKQGSDVIDLVGQLLKEAVKEKGSTEDLVGHIGGDDYVILTEPLRAEEMAKAIINAFDSKMPELYNQEDLDTGFIPGIDRDGTKRTFPLLTISIAITLSENLAHPSIVEISQNCAKMKQHLKQRKGSNYLIDRRKQLS